MAAPEGLELHEAFVIKGEDGARSIRRLIGRGKGGTFKGILCDVDVLSETLQSWTRSRVSVLEDFAATGGAGAGGASGSRSPANPRGARKRPRRTVPVSDDEDWSREERTRVEHLHKLAVAAVCALKEIPSVGVDISEGRLVELQDQLASLRDPRGVLARVRESQASSLGRASAEAKEAQAALEEWELRRESSSEAAEVARAQTSQAKARSESLKQEVLELTRQLAEATRQQASAERSADSHHLAMIRAEDGVREAEAELARARTAAEAASGTMHAASATVTALENGLVDLEDTVVAMDEALVKRWKRRETELEAWSAQEVAGWLRRLEGEDLSGHAEEFCRQGVTGALLARGLSHEELMALGMRNLRQRRFLLEAVEKLCARNRGAEEPPSELVCPITRAVMKDPVAIVGDSQGHGYERSSIERWFADGRNTVPMTNQELRGEEARKLVPLRMLGRKALEWRRAHHK